MKEAGPGSHSDDEIIMNGGVPTARSRRLVWRSKKMGKAYYICDALNLDDKFDAQGNIKSGLFPRPRIIGDVESTKKPVKGLPRNCYDEEWLAAMDSDDREDLGVRDEEADLSIPPKLEKYVSSPQAIRLGLIVCYRLYEDMQNKQYDPARIVPLVKAGPSRRKIRRAVVSSDSES